MLKLPTVTVVIADTINPGGAVNALQKTLAQIQPAKAIWFTDIPYTSDQFEVVQIPTMKSIEDYSRFMLKELYHHLPLTGGHILVIQHDGYVLDASQWMDEFLNYDYIGSPWPRTDKYQVGNGGFSLRSESLIAAIAQDNFIPAINPEDNTISILYRDYLEEKGFRWAPVELAHRFGFELYEPRCHTFGFHNYHYPPFKPYIVIKREGALGDVVALEPVLRYYHEHGYNVVLDSPCWPLFAMHDFRVINYSEFDKAIPHKVISLDLAYETKPQQLHLKSYYEMCGITDGKIVRPRLNYRVTPQNKLFRKYVVVHIDDRDTVTRNIYGVNWKNVQQYLEEQGYTVIQVGHGNHAECGHWFNTVNIPMLLWVLAGSDFFIGVDSGPSNIAVALNIPSIIFMGSVDPKVIHPSMTDVYAVTSPCSFNRQYCWTEKPGTTGSQCPANTPPCCFHDTAKVIDRIEGLITVL